MSSQSFAISRHDTYVLAPIFQITSSESSSETHIHGTVSPSMVVVILVLQIESSAFITAPAGCKFRIKPLTFIRTRLRPLLAPSLRNLVITNMTCVSSNRAEALCHYPLLESLVVYGPFRPPRRGTEKKLLEFPLLMPNPFLPQLQHLSIRGWISFLHVRTFLLKSAQNIATYPRLHLHMEIFALCNDVHSRQDSNMMVISLLYSFIIGCVIGH